MKKKRLKALLETVLKKPFDSLLKNLRQRDETLIRLASFPEINPNPVVETDLFGQVNYANPAARQVFPDLQTTGPRHPWLDGINEVAQRLKDQQKFSTVRELKINDTWYEQSIYVAEGQRLRIYGLDITERKQAEEALHIALQDSKRHEAEISALLEGSRAVLEYHEFKESARSLFDSCKKAIGAPAGYVSLLSKEGNENEVFFLDSGGLPCTVDPDLPMPIRGLREVAYRTEKTVFDNNFSKSEYISFMPEGHVRLENVLFAPLPIKGQIIGLLGLANKTGGFTENDARLATAFGELAAIALYNSRTLESLGMSEERFRAVVQTANDAIISIDQQGFIIFCNKSAEIIFGYSADEVIGKSLHFLMPERFREAHQNALNRAIATGQSDLIGKPIETVGVKRDKSEFPLELSLAKWESKEGIFFTGILRDITKWKEAEAALQNLNVELELRVKQRTADLMFANEQLKQEMEERKKAEEALHESEIKYRIVADNTYDWEWWLGPGNKFIYVSPSCQRITGREPKEFLEDPDLLFNIIHPEDHPVFLRHQNEIEQNIETGEAEFRIVRPDGSYRWIGHICQPIVDREGNLLGHRGSNRDITERKVAEERLRESENHLRLLSSQLLTIQENERKRVARELHDGIGQTLAAIKFSLENKLNQVGTGTPPPHPGISLENIIALTQNGIDEARRIQMDLRPSILDDLGISATLGWFCREFEKIYSAIHIKTQIKLQEQEVPAPLKTVIYRVTQEALNNIAKYSKADHVNLSLEKGKRGIELTIEDNGIGFDIEEVRKGFGLSSMKERTELSGGTFSIESMKEKGTTLRASWPL